MNRAGRYKLTYTEELVHKHLITYMGGATQKRVKLPDIAKSLGVSVSSCQKLLTKLSLLGIIEKQIRGREGVLITVLDEETFNNIK